ncbi:MAG: alpha/beta fold hydrolase, partial [Planctomycetes bacterium]|nr:alpha/beta fold hydrolase [Planctomycetota bacterium]
TYTLEQAQSTALENSLTLWPAQDGQYLGALSETPLDPPLGTVLFFHGNAGSALTRTYFANTLNAVGYRVVLVEYPGYGARAGSLGEASMVTSGCQAVQQAQTQFGDPLFVVAESLGCGVACAVARDTRDAIRGLLLITPWDTLPNLAQQRYPLFPIRKLCKDRYHSIDNLRQVECPVGLLIAGEDDVIPPERAENLAKQLTRPAHVWTFPQAGHNDWFSFVDTHWWQQAMNILNPEPQT